MEEPLSPVIPTNEIQPPTVGVGFGVRLGARIIDTLIHNMIGFVFPFGLFIIIAIYGLIADVSTEPIITRAGKSSLLDFVCALLGSIAFHAICEYIYGASPGKLILQIHVKNENGGPISLVAALSRSAAYFVDSLFFGLVAYESMKKSPLNQRNGDKWAKTVVVKRSDLTPAQIPSWWRFFVALVVAIFADGIISTIPSVFKILLPG